MTNGVTRYSVFQIGVACSGARPLRAPRGRRDHAALRQAASGEGAGTCYADLKKGRAPRGHRRRRNAPDAIAAVIDQSCREQAAADRAKGVHTGVAAADAEAPSKAAAFLTSFGATHRRAP